MGARGTAVRSAAVCLLALGLLAGCGQSDAPDDKLQPVQSTQVARIMPPEEVLEGANIPTLDPHTMVEAEVGRAIGDGARCEFRYTGAGGPVLAVSTPGDGAAESGVLKLNGGLVLLEPADGPGEREGVLLAAGPIRATVSPDRSDEPEELNGARRQEGDMIFEIRDQLRVGYRGFLDCMSEPPVRPSRG